MIIGNNHVLGIGIDIGGSVIVDSEDKLVKHYLWMITDYSPPMWTIVWEIILIQTVNLSRGTLPKAGFPRVRMFKCTSENAEPLNIIGVTTARLLNCGWH